MRHFLIAGLVFTGFYGSAYADCRTVSQCANCAISVSMPSAQDVNITGNELPTLIGSHNGTDLTYSGPAQSNFLSYGPYYSQAGSEVRVIPAITISTNWNPGQYQTCNHRDWRSACTAWDWHDNDSSFTIDMAIKGGQVIWSQDYHGMNHENHARITLPEVVCDGGLENLEVRIHNAKGGNVDFSVHELNLSTRWKD